MIIIKDIQYITDIEKLKVISDPLRISILTTLGTEKKNSKELAKLLKINRTKIHYHHLHLVSLMTYLTILQLILI